MPPIHSRPVSVPIDQIDEEWAESLVGCRLNVDDDWWPENPGGSGSNPGVIHHVDFSQSRARYFVVEQGDFHPMPFNDVFRYADENQQGFSRFRLPRHALPSPDGEGLCYAMWADNNIVRTLSNFHRPEILEAGLKRKRKVNKMRE